MYVRNYVDQTLQPLILSKQWNELTLIVFFFICRRQLPSQHDVFDQLHFTMTQFMRKPLT